jgi:hypothetical protein
MTANKKARAAKSKAKSTVLKVAMPTWDHVCQHLDEAHAHLESHGHPIDPELVVEKLHDAARLLVAVINNPSLIASGVDTECLIANIVTDAILFAEGFAADDSVDTSDENRPKGTVVH